MLFGAEGRHLTDNILVLRVQPSEGISLSINAKTPGTVTRIAPAQMDFNYDVAFGSYSPEAYERLLLDAILGDSTLFIRDDEVEGAWRIIDSIEAGWAAGSPSISFYPRGHMGPPGSDRPPRSRGPTLVRDDRPAPAAAQSGTGRVACRLRPAKVAPWRKPGAFSDSPPRHRGRGLPARSYFDLLLRCSYRARI